MVVIRDTDSGSRGFTLSELLTGLAVLTVLSAIALPRFSDSLIRARLAEFQCKAHAISLAHVQFALEYGTTPEDVHCPGKCGNDCVSDIPDDTDADFFYRCTLRKRLPLQVFLDPFNDIAESAPVPLMAMPKGTLNAKIPFAGGDGSGSVLATLGPDGGTVTGNAMVGFQGIIYGPTNGIRSSGDVLVMIPEERSLEFQGRNR